jgi:gamma-glutamyl:cysteine ligase YbdK (ATP-grasp superfamily)
MGQEISNYRFEKRDFHRFRTRLQVETDRLQQLFDEAAFSTAAEVGGFEIEAWLIDAAAMAAPINAAYLKALADPLVVPELARFNVEINTPPRTLAGDVLRQMHARLADTWVICRRTAAEMQADLLMVGILPTVQNHELNLENMSEMTRYWALNQQVLQQRRGHPLHLDIPGREHLTVEHRDVMLESAATSFQIHLQVPLASSVRYYNAAIALSAPMVAATANSPYLFGKDLWDETRIPLFEQAVEVGGIEAASFGPIRRVTFGNGYVRESLMECFLENLEHYPVLLPVDLGDDVSELPHVRLHNGTIWRWNRPLIGFDDSDRPHLRVEHRVVPSGPSVIDVIANAALFFGLAAWFAREAPPLEAQIDFSSARDNFYMAARYGLDGHLNWCGRSVTAQAVLLEQLIPCARRGLQRLELDAADISDYLDIIEARVATKRTGAAWQREFVAVHGRDMRALTKAYRDRQNSGIPVHEWLV